MIEVRQHEDKWRITIHQEAWEMTQEELKIVFDTLIRLKSQYGKITRPDAHRSVQMNLRVMK
jgi:hypothetical protein